MRFPLQTLGLTLVTFAEAWRYALSNVVSAIDLAEKGARSSDDAEHVLAGHLTPVSPGCEGGRLKMTPVSGLKRVSRHQSEE
jgi:hypothetical protein